MPQNIFAAFIFSSIYFLILVACQTGYAAEIVTYNRAKLFQSKSPSDECHKAPSSWFKAGTSRHSSYKPPESGALILFEHPPGYITHKLRGVKSQNDTLNSDCYILLKKEVLACNLLKSFFTPCLKSIVPKSSGKIVIFAV